MNLRLIAFLLFISFFSCKILIKSDDPSTGLVPRNLEFEIKEIYHKEVQYLKARVSNDLNTLYTYQHPEYKAVISLDKFVLADGYIQLNYSSDTADNPLPQIYAHIRQFPVILKDFKIEECFIDKNGRYAKFHIILIMDLFLPIAKGVPLRKEMKYIDYWEKINGEWVILNKVRPDPFAHISGAATKNPINLPEEKAEYIEVDTKPFAAD